MTMKEQELPLPAKKKNESHLRLGKDKLLDPLLIITLACCLMMARRL